MSASPSTDIFPAKTNHVWKIPTRAAVYAKTSNPLVGNVFAETLIASSSGIIAKNAFVYSTLKHPTRNFFVLHKKDIGDMTFQSHEADPSLIERQDWMAKDEEDAISELDTKANDPASEIEEQLLEMILGFGRKTAV